MQGKEQKQPHEREADQNENRLENSINHPPQQSDSAVEAESVQDGVVADREFQEGDPFADTRSEKRPDNEERLRGQEQQQQEQTILEQWQINLPNTNQAETDRVALEQEEAPVAEDKQEPAGRLIWKKEEYEGAGQVPNSVTEEPQEESQEEVGVFQQAPPLSRQMAPASAIEEESKKKKGIRTRWKVLLYLFLGIPVLTAVALIGGLLIGYSVVGEDSAGDIFSRDLWQHLYDLIYG